MRVNFNSLFKHSVFKGIGWIGTRFITLIFLFILLFRWLSNPLQMVSKSLNQMMPASFSCLNNYNSSEGHCTREELNGFVKYFTQVVKRFPRQPDGYGLLAFCYYHLNAIDKSKEFYLKALSLNSHFFWYHFNLGIIYLKEGDYQRAEEYFNRSLEVDANLTSQYIFNSIIYRPLKENIQELEDFIQKKLFVGYSYAKSLSKISYYLQNFDKFVNHSELIDRSLVHLDHVYYRLGLEAFEKGFLNSSEIFMRKTIAMNPQYADAFRYLGLIFQSQGKNQLAKGYFEEANQLVKTHNPLRSFEGEITPQIF